MAGSCTGARGGNGGGRSGGSGRRLGLSRHLFRNRAPCGRCGRRDGGSNTRPISEQGPRQCRVPRLSQNWGAAIGASRSSRHGATNPRLRRTARKRRRCRTGCSRSSPRRSTAGRVCADAGVAASGQGAAAPAGAIYVADACRCRRVRRERTSASGLLQKAGTAASRNEAGPVSASMSVRPDDPAEPFHGYRDLARSAEPMTRMSWPKRPVRFAAG